MKWAGLAKSFGPTILYSIKMSRKKLYEKKKKSLFLYEKISLLKNFKKAKKEKKKELKRLRVGKTNQDKFK